ncbi:OLC1v1027966C1 [Oldenlandia corymbosa var. corymbosa]|uniref:OLC1v1027966C1 n=1 Tax=Oldenlandia corymbosa var. corymbosa TaxID=529605 RepID=A0AAV1CAV9_OLDCO|nr:OLC1v1027966C1 [Oldenlandia corymbosa var. corymbosa]
MLAFNNKNKVIIKGPLLPLSILTFLFATSFSFVFGADGADSSHFPTAVSGGFGKQNYGVLVSSLRTTQRRVLADDNNITPYTANTTPEGDEEPPLNSTYLTLAAKRTYRKDPLDGFNKYTGGWNISNEHYWASVGYTAVPFFLVAGIWFLVFGLCLLLMCLYFSCCRKEPYGYSRTAYALSLILLIFFTVVAIVGCITLYVGQDKFHTSTTRTLQYVVDQADGTVSNIKNVSGYLSAAKQVGVAQVFLPANVQSDIDEIQNKLNSSATTLSTRTEKNSKDIRDVIASVRLALILLSAIMLFLTFLGFVFSLFGMQLLVYTLVIAGWILVTGTFILCGIFLLLHNVTGDTCVSMNQWVQNPTAYTSLDDILPCVDNATAQETLSRSKEVTSQLVEVINEVITNVSNINFAPAFVPFYYNQSGPPLPLLCNPFNGDLSNRTCSSGEVDLDNATQVWSNYVCQVSPNGVCVTPGRLTPSLYGQMAAGINVSFGLYHYGPYLVSLQDCSFVRQTFNDIYTTYCPGLLRYSKWVYIGLVMVAVAVMLSLLFWVIYGRERRHRVYTKEHTPKPTEGEVYEGDKPAY